MVEVLALRVRQAAEVLSVSENMVFKLIREGKLEKIKIGRSTRITVAELERFIGEGPAMEASPNPTAVEPINLP